MSAANEIDFLSARLVSLRALSWDGPLPAPGEYIRTERGATAYLVHAVRENRRPDPRSRALFRCWKVPAASVPAGSVVHPWAWSARG